MKKVNALLLVLGSVLAAPSFADDSQALQDRLATLKSFKAQFAGLPKSQGNHLCSGLRIHLYQQDQEKVESNYFCRP